MRKIVEEPLHKLDDLDGCFNGFFEDESGYFSDASLYDYNDGTEDLDSFNAEFVGHNPTLKNKSQIKLPKIAKDRVYMDEGKQRQHVDIKQRKKNAFVIKSGTNTSIKSKAVDKSSSEKLVERQNNISKTKVSKCKYNVERENNEGDSVTSSYDSGPGMKTKREPRNQEVKERKAKDILQHSISVDAEQIGDEIKSFRRRKTLCKAADVSASEAKQKGKGKGKTGLRAVMHDNGMTGSLCGGRLRKEIDEHTSDSDVHTKEEDETAWAEILGKAKPGSPKNLLTKVNESIRVSKNKSIVKCEDLSSTSKEVISSEHQIPTNRVAEIKDDHTVKDFSTSLDTVHNVFDPQRLLVERNGENGVLGDEVSSGVTEGGEGNKEHEKGDGSSNAEPGPADVGWVLCDSCGKWRCIPSSLADSIEASDCVWLCKDNPNKKFADCSVPQEKTDSEINAELDIADGSFCEDDEKDPPIDSKFSNDLECQSLAQSSWTLIKHNIFQHRRNKILTADEQMVCGCVPPEDGSPGCGEDCLNRMLSIECVSQTCPCGDACSNQQFQKRLYKNVGWFRCGKKGFGLQVLEDVSMGSFLIEYVGEVLEMAAYEARQKEYAMRGQKHFYFMRLNSNEVIDACDKGNLGRFINHSCEPNCRTEKWTVNGEICIGLFATRDLKKGEEITFDYNYVRVSGAVAKKCLCGARECRGYIGGDPLTPVSIFESNSDEDDPEPIMVEKSSEDESWTEGRKQMLDKKALEKSCLPDRREKLLISESEKEAASRKQIKRKLITRKLGSIKLKKLTESTEGSDEGVEDVNKLLDENGGLCKRMHTAEETATCYMKVLALKATESLKETESGYIINGETCRSTRDLSMLLDVILKTQTRMVLLEVMRKNGMQILHGIIKHSKKDYKKTPIVRKALRVLEFLAMKRILTSDQINSDPSYGSESLRETIFQLCRHADSEVQKIAHRFRDNWYQHSFHKPRGGLQHANQQNSPLDTHNNGSLKRKRSSRWDQPSQEVLDATLAGGLPKSFWPFNATNLLSGNHYPDENLQKTPIYTSSEIQRSYADPPLTPAIIQQCPTINQTGNHVAGLVSGIPIEQFIAGPSTGFVSQQGTICVGIPVAQFQAAQIGGSDCSFFPQALPSSHQVNHNGDEQAISCDVGEMSDDKPLENGFRPYDQPDNHDITFGISPSQFFQQMHRLFGSVFHPWQLQALMAPHSSGPFLSGDARLKILNSVADSGRSTEPNGRDERACMYGEPNRSIDRELDSEPPVPGLSPPSLHGFPPARQPSKPLSVGRQYMGTEHPRRGNFSHQHGNSASWRPYRSNSSRWMPKFDGHKQKDFGLKRDFYSSRRNNRQNFHRQAGPSSHSCWEDGSYWQEADAEEYRIGHDEAIEDVGNVPGNIPLERPWGYGQNEYYSKEDSSNYLDAPGEFP